MTDARLVFAVKVTGHVLADEQKDGWTIFARCRRLDAR